MKDGPTVCGKEEVGRVLALEPSDLVDFLLNLQGLEVVKLRLVGLRDCGPSYKLARSFTQ
jgi:hypothetical protein